MRVGIIVYRAYVCTLHQVANSNAMEFVPPAATATVGGIHATTLQCESPLPVVRAIASFVSLYCSSSGTTAQS